MVYVSKTGFDDLRKALACCMPYETVVFLGFEVKCFPFRDGSCFYRVIAPGFASIDLSDIGSVFHTVSWLYDNEHPMFQPELDFGGDCIKNLI